MKIITFRDGIFVPGVNVQNIKRIQMNSKGKYHPAAEQDTDDKFVVIGNGNQTTGRLFLERCSPPILQGNKIYNADIVKKEIPFHANFLTKEINGDDTTLLFFLKKVIKIPKSLFNNGDDYVVKIHQGEEIAIESLEFGDIKVFNRLKSRDFIRYEIQIKTMSDSLYVIK